MPGDKYIANNAGTLTEVAGTQVSAGAGNSGDIPALDSTGKLDSSLLPVGVGADTNQIQASENLAAGDFVNIWSSAGAFRVRKADASTNKPCHGFVLSVVTSGNTATVYSEGHNTQLTGVTPGQQFLSDITPGGFTPTAPTTAGSIVQRVGIGVSATEINFEPEQQIVLA